MASLLILCYSLLILAFFTIHACSFLARPLWIFIYFSFFVPLSPGTFSGWRHGRRRGEGKARSLVAIYDEAYELRYLVTLDSLARSEGRLYFFFLLVCTCWFFTRCFGLAFAADWMSLQKFGG